MKAGKCSLAVLGLSAAVIFAGPAQAAGLLFLSDTAAGRMNKEDFKLMSAAAVEALNDSATPSVKSWSNPKSGASGTVDTVQAFTAKSGEACKLLHTSSKAKSLTHELTSTACKVKGSWKLVSEDFAKAPAAK
jgi:surface antigen